MVDSSRKTLPEKFLLTIRSGFGYITVPSSQRSLKRFAKTTDAVLTLVAKRD